MRHANNTISLLRRELISRDGDIEKLSARVAELEPLAEAQAALIAANGERERLLLQIIANALAALDRDTIGSARFHLLAANAHPRLEELNAQIETASAAIARALPLGIVAPAMLEPVAS